MKALWIDWIVWQVQRFEKTLNNWWIKTSDDIRDAVPNATPSLAEWWNEAKARDVSRNYVENPSNIDNSNIWWYTRDWRESVSENTKWRLLDTLA